MTDQEEVSATHLVTQKEKKSKIHTVPKKQ